MFELLSVLMCGGGPAAVPAPAYVPQPIRQGLRSASSATKRSQSSAKTGGGGFGIGSGGSLFAGSQGIGDQSLSTGKTLLGG